MSQKSCLILFRRIMTTIIFLKFEYSHTTDIVVEGPTTGHCSMRGFTMHIHQCIGVVMDCVLCSEETSTNVDDVLAVEGQNKDSTVKNMKGASEEISELVIISFNRTCTCMCLYVTGFCFK